MTQIINIAAYKFVGLTNLEQRKAEVLLQAQALEIDLLNPAEFRSFLASELGKWSKLVKDSGAKLD